MVHSRRTVCRVLAVELLTTTANLELKQIPTLVDAVLLLVAGARFSIFSSSSTGSIKKMYFSWYIEFLFSFFLEMGFVWYTNEEMLLMGIDCCHKLFFFKIIFSFFSLLMVFLYTTAYSKLNLSVNNSI